MQNIIKSPEYKWKTFVREHDVDQNKNIKPSAIMRYMQETSEYHLTANNTPHSFLYDQGLVFVLIDVRVNIYNTPKLNNTLEIYTWQKGVEKTRFYRHYEFYNTLGETVIEATTVSVCIDSVTRKILRPHSYTKFDIPCLADKNPTPNVDIEKITLSQNKGFSGTRKIYYSDIDYNGHLNNTVYADIMQDFFPNGMKNRQIKNFSINFASESFEGDSLDIFTETQLQNEITFVGIREETIGFKGKMTY